MIKHTDGSECRYTRGLLTPPCPELHHELTAPRTEPEAEAEVRWCDRWLFRGFSGPATVEAWRGRTGGFA